MGQRATELRGRVFRFPHEDIYNMVAQMTTVTPPKESCQLRGIWPRYVTGTVGARE